MLVHELNRADCLAILWRNNVGRLGYSHFDQPYVVPIHYSLDVEQGCLYGFSTLGEKVSCMRRNPRVCLEVDEIVDKNHWVTALAVGRYREIHRGHLEDQARRRAEKLFNERFEWWLPGAAKLGAEGHEEAVIYQISIDRLTGRRANRNDAASPRADAIA